MRALWDYAAFACTAEFTVFVRTVRLCRVCARLGGSPLSHVPWAFASPVPALEFRRFRMCRGAFAAPVPVLGFASFACAVGLCRTRACFGVSPLSHAPWAFAAPVPALGFRRFSMCRGHLPHPCLLWGFAAFACAVDIYHTRACFGISPLSHVQRPLPRPYLLWNFATFACTAGLCRGRVHLGHCPVHACVLTLLLQMPRSFDVYVRTAAFM